VIGSVLVVCIGNICRSPVGERVLQAQLPKITVTSAGLGALVGHDADETARDVAAQNGVSLDGHIARQFTAELAATQDLILVMEPKHRQEIGRIAPHLLGKTMLYDHWTEAKGIADPYRLSREFHELTYVKIEAAGKAWAARLAKTK
jgi:protein-tyrosine phosphatase